MLKTCLYALLIAIGLCLPLAAGDESDIEALLADLRIASDLSNQTKREAGGSVIVYTRDMLERMQAYNLRDILKTIPIFTLQETVTGPVGMAKATGATFNSQYLKFYINDHELGSVVYGSAMKMWGYMDISHIDHIEIYQTGSSVSAGDEPPGMVIRLYTKDPTHDSGSQIQGIFSSRGSSEYNVYHAGTSEGLSYFAYFDIHSEQRQDYHTGTATINRDFDSDNFFGSLSGTDFKIDIAQFNLDQSGLFGLGRGKLPTDNYLDLKHQYLSYTQYFQEKSLKLKAAYDKATHIRYDNDPTGIALNDGTIANSWHYDKDESVLGISLSKQFTYESHDIELGVEFKDKRYDPVSLTVDGVEQRDVISPYRRLDIYSLFLTDNITIDASNLFFYTLKYDYHVHNGGLSDTDNYVARLGYIHNDATWLWKSFLVHTYGYPVFLESSYFPFVFMQNEKLTDEDRYAATTELHYRTDSTISSIRVIYNTLKDGIVLQPSTPQTYVNNSERPEFYALYLSHEYKFDPFNRIIMSGYTSDNDQPSLKSSRSGYLLQLFNTLGRFDLYNELVYRSGYAYDASPTTKVEVKDGYDYTVAITYHPTRDLTLSIKGENLIEKAIETPYPIPARNTTEYIAPFDKTVRFGVKYVF